MCIRDRATDVLTLMRDLNREQGQTFVIVTHDPKIGDLCDRVIHMQDGEIVADVRDEIADLCTGTPGAVAAGE